MAFCNVEFFSQALNRWTRCGVFLPTDQGPYRELEVKTPLPTLYLLHGMTESQTTWLNMESLWEIADRYRLAIVLPNGENSFYTDSPLTGAAYSTYLCGELVEWTRDTFPLSHRREETFLGGLSMGGFGAVVNGLRHPETFGYVTAFSAALIKRLILRADEEPGLDFFTRVQYQSMFGLENIRDYDGCGWDYETLAKQLAASGKEKPKFYLDCGTEDVSLHRANSDFKDLLLNLGYEVVWDSRPGLHDRAFWNVSLQKAMEFLPVEKLEYQPDSPTQKAMERQNGAMVEKMKI